MKYIASLSYLSLANSTGIHFLQPKNDCNWSLHLLDEMLLIVVCNKITKSGSFLQATWKHLHKSLVTTA